MVRGFLLFVDFQFLESYFRFLYFFLVLGLVQANYNIFHFETINIRNNVTDSKKITSVESFACKKCDYKAESSTGLEAHIAFAH